jgi:SAM-dependent methyltransferase
MGAVTDFDDVILRHREGDAAWFEAMYARDRAGGLSVPWRTVSNQALSSWALARGISYREVFGESGEGCLEFRNAVVVGCGFGDDAERLAGQGVPNITAFDISESAIAGAKELHPASPVDYRVADWLNLPPEWHGAFELVVESYNLGALPASSRARAVAGISSLVAPGGRLLVIAGISGPPEVKPGGGALPERPPPTAPFALTREEIESFAAEGSLEVEGVEKVAAPGSWILSRFCAEFRRPGGVG